MNLKMYTIFYIISILAIILSIILVEDLSDSIQMLLAATAVILTSIFTYSTRHVIPYRRSKENRSE